MSVRDERGGIVTATRYHDFSCGHRVFGHESKCAHLHGHNYRVHFDVEMLMDASGDFKGTDNIGRVIDFSVIKEILCEWLERQWDHKFLVWEKDPWAAGLKTVDPEGVVIIPFNPTAENMAGYLTQEIAPSLLCDTAVINKYGLLAVVKCTVEETRKCSASYSLKGS